MPTPNFHRPGGGFIPGALVPTPVNRPLLPRPTLGSRGLAPDAITDFLASLMKQHESAAVIFPATRRL